MKLKTKIGIIFFIGAILVTAIPSSFFYYVNRTIIKKEIFSKLNLVANSRAQHIDSILQLNSETIILMTKSFTIKDFITLDKDSPKYKNAFLKVQDRLKTVIETHPEIHEIDILDTRGMIIASSTPKKIGKDLSQCKCLSEGKDKTFIQGITYNDNAQTYDLLISSPIKNGKFWGILRLAFHAQEIYNVTTNNKGLGKTGEVYLVNKDLLMVSPSRFEKNAILKIKINSINAQNCFIHLKEGKEHPASSIIYKNYLGQKVIGAHSSIKKIDWCLIAEMDKNEAFAPLNTILMIFIGQTLFISILAFLIGYFVAKIINKPLHTLQEGVKKIGEGNLDYQIPITSKDEIGNLSNAFNKMASNLKQSTASIASLNKEIEKRNIIAQELAISKAKYQALFETSADAIMILTLNTNFYIANKATLELFGFKNEEEFKNYTPYQLSPEYQPDGQLSAEKAKAMIKKTLDEGSCYFEWLHKKLTGKEFYATVLLTKLQYNNKILIQATVRDITKEKETQENLKKALAAKAEFTSIISHELKTPLSAIKESYLLLLDSVEKNLNPEQNSLADTTKRNIERLSRIVNNILDLRKLELGKMEFNMQPNDINQIITEAVKLSTPIAKNKNLALKTNLTKDLPQIICDGDGIYQVIINLLNNAIKFTDTGSITVASKKTDTSIIVSVSDTGVGIKKEDFEKLFQYFTQLGDKHKRKPGSTGLGLAISKKILETHGGRIWVESEVNKGTTFSFELYLKKE